MVPLVCLGPMLEDLLRPWTSLVKHECMRDICDFNRHKAKKAEKCIMEKLGNKCHGMFDLFDACSSAVFLN